MSLIDRPRPITPVTVYWRELRKLVPELEGQLTVAEESAARKRQTARRTETIASQAEHERNNIAAEIARTQGEIERLQSEWNFEGYQ